LVEQKQKQEEKDRLQKEKVEQEERERLERQMKMQQEKEREIEERERQKQEEIQQMRQTDEKPVDGWRRGERDDGGWRNEDVRPEEKRSPRMDRSYGPPRGRDDGYDDRRRDDGGWRRDEGPRWPGREDRRGYRDDRRDRDDDNWRRDDRSRDLSPSFKRGSETRPDAVSFQ